MMAIQYIKQQPDVLTRKSIVLTNDIDEVTRLISYTDEMCEAAGFTPDATSQIRLAVEEAVVNVINYAYPPATHCDITVEVQIKNTGIKFTIIDCGTPFDPTAYPEADITLSAAERAIGGMGIHLVRQIMDSVGYQRMGDLNVLTLTKLLKSEN